MLKNRLAFLASLTLAGLLALPGCSTNTQGDDAGPVFLTVEFTLLPLEKNVADALPLQFQTTTLKSILKIPNPTTMQFLDTQVDDYIVTWERLDGGTKIPASERFGGNVVVPAGGTSTLMNYPFMTASALLLPPLDQLFPFNGGIDRETGKNEIRLRGVVTVRGHTLSGQQVRGTGNFDMFFVYIPLTGQITARPARKP